MTPAPGPIPVGRVVNPMVCPTTTPAPYVFAYPWGMSVKMSDKADVRLDRFAADFSSETFGWVTGPATTLSDPTRTYTNVGDARLAVDSGQRPVGVLVLLNGQNGNYTRDIHIVTNSGDVGSAPHFGYHKGMGNGVYLSPDIVASNGSASFLSWDMYNTTYNYSQMSCVPAGDAACAVSGKTTLNVQPHMSLLGYLDSGVVFGITASLSYQPQVWNGSSLSPMSTSHLPSSFTSGMMMGPTAQPYLTGTGALFVGPTPEPGDPYSMPTWGSLWACPVPGSGCYSPLPIGTFAHETLGNVTYRAAAMNALGVARIQGATWIAIRVDYVDASTVAPSQWNYGPAGYPTLTASYQNKKQRFFLAPASTLTQLTPLTELVPYDYSSHFLDLPNGSGHVLVYADPTASVQRIVRIGANAQAHPALNVPYASPGGYYGPRSWVKGYFSQGDYYGLVDAFGCVAILKTTP